MTAEQFQELLRCLRDPWHFVTHHIRTQDPARGELPYPSFDYLRELIIAAQQHRYLLVPKSRQMMVTWTMTAYTLWRALFRGPGLYLYLSRNERCAEELIARTRFMIERLPEFMRPRLTGNSREEISFGKLGSRILSLPASPNGPRMYSPSGVFWDEMAFTPYDEYIWSALKPALDSGGRFVGVSSSGGALNLFAKMATTPSPPVHGGTEGGLFHIHQVHYSLHPDKQTDEWKQHAAQGLSHTRWQMEQEISFDAQNDLVYDEFDPQRHILPEDWRVNPLGEVYRSIDFGYRHPFVLWIQRTDEDDFIVFDEWSVENRTTEEMRLAIHNVDLSHGLSEARVRWSACDPAGAAAQDSGLSPVDVLRRAGMKLCYRSSRIAPGLERVKAALCDTTGRVRLRIAPRCQKLIADLSRYRWAAGGDEPQKDGVCDHSLDALRYFFVNYDSATDSLPALPRITGMRR